MRSAGVASELLKLRTVRSTWGYVIAVVALAALVTVGSIGSESEAGRLAAEFQRNLVLDAASPVLLIGLLLGCIVVTNEFRHGTITPTLLVLPRRETLLGIKLTAAAVAAGALALAAAVVVLAVAAVWLTILDVSLDTGDLARGVGRATLAAALAGLMGAAVGGLVQSQVAALVGILVWIFVAEPLVWVLLGLLDVGGVAEYLYAATVLGLADSSDEGLPFEARVGVGIGWSAAIALLGWLRLRRRDIT